jgi:hypothetical protein
VNLHRKTATLTTLAILLSAGLVAGNANAAPGSVAAAKAKSFKITGGTVTLTLDPAFTGALTDAGATFTVSGKASSAVNKDTGLTEVTFPVKKNGGNVLSLQPWCRCAKIYLDGTIHINGSNTSRTGTSPILQIDGSTRGGITATFTLGGYGDETVGGINAYPLPKSFGGKTISLDLGTMTDLGFGILYRGMTRYAGEPGDGPMPNYNGGPIGQVGVDLKLQPQR